MIRKAVPSDAIEIAATEAMLFESPSKEPAILRAIKSSRNTVFVAEDESGVFGHVILGKGDDSSSLRLLDVAVRIDRQREGAGKQLVEMAKKSLRNGKMRIHASVSVNNLPTLNLLAKCGFSNQQEHEGKYPFMFSVPLDDLSATHIAAIAAERKRDRAC